MKATYHPPFRMKQRLAGYLCILLCLLCLTMLFSSCISSPKQEKHDAHQAAMTQVIQSIEHPISLPAPLFGISARSAVLLRADTGDVLWEQNPHTPLPMASTTKIMTALVAIETLPIDTIIQTPLEAVGIEGSSIYLTEGERLTLEQLLYALMLSSANDAAVAIALACAGSVEDFAHLMNKKAQDLGLQNTHFVNPHGLDDAAHYTTAYELACITQAALAHPTLKTIMSTPKTTIPHGETGVRLLVNHNKLLRTYDRAVGGKTGFTKKSGRCLVSAAEANGLTLIAVTLNDPNDWHDHASMLDYGFSLFDTLELCQVGEFERPLPVISGEIAYVMVSNKEALTLPIYKGYGDIFCVVELHRMVYAPVEQDDLMGQVVYYAVSPDGERHELGKVALYACYPVEQTAYRQSLGDWLKDLFS